MPPKKRTAPSPDESPPGVAAVVTPPAESAEDVLERMRRESHNTLLKLQLQQPFHPDQVRWKPQMVKNNRALAIAYIDARLVQERLDDVYGVEGWGDDYDVLPDGSVVCRLTCGGVTKCDVGSLSEQPDAGDRLKAAFSDALKRAAVKFGVGRYLYGLPHQWVDYDPVKKQITQKPTLPAWAVPKKLPAAVMVYDEPEVATVVSDAGTNDAAGKEGPKANGKPAAKGSTLEEVTKDWQNKLASCQTPRDLNAMLPALKSLPEDQKKAVKKMIARGANSVGWAWDDAAGGFVDANKSDPAETIPF